MSQPLYWSIEKFSLRYAYFLFFDTIPYLADQLFIRRQIRVWFDREYAKKDSPCGPVPCPEKRCAAVSGGPGGSEKEYAALWAS